LPTPPNLDQVDFDGDALFTIGFDGDITRWHIPPVPPEPEFTERMERTLRCLPVRFDPATGNLTDQVRHCEF
jgi:hypothetical protein